MKLLLQFCLLALLLGLTLPCAAAPSLVDHYRKALKADPQNPTLRYHLGVALLTQGENKQAIKAFRKAYPSLSDDAEINFNLALAYSRVSDPDSALIYLDQVATEIAPQAETYPLNTIYSNLVILYEQQGRLDDAVVLLKRLLHEEPASLDSLRMLAEFQLRLGRIDEAVMLFGKYLEQAPTDSEMREYIFASLFNRGLEAYKKEEFKRASFEFKRVLQFKPDNILVLYYLSLLDYQQQKFEQIAERLPQLFERLNEAQRETARSILFNTALSLKQSDHFSLAEKALAPLSRGQDPHAKDFILLAGIELKTGAYALARQHYYRALELDPDQASVAEGIQVAEKGTFEELLKTVGRAFAAGNLLIVKKNLDQAAEIYPKNNRLKIYQMRFANASRKKWLALQERAHELENQQKLVEALSVLRQGLRLAPTEPLLIDQETRLVGRLATRIAQLQKTGRNFYDQGSLFAARQQFKQLVLLSPEHRVGNIYLQKIESSLQQQAQQALGVGDAALARGDLDEARQAFRAALVAWPTEPAALKGLIQVEDLFKQRVTETLVQVRQAQAEGQLLTAQQLLIVAVQSLPGTVLDDELSTLNAQIAQQQKELQQRVRLAIDKRQFSMAAQLLTKVRLAGVTSVAIEKLNRELQRAQAVEVKVQLRLARQQEIAGDFDAALKGYRRALDIDPGNDKALIGLKAGRNALRGKINDYLAVANAALRAGHIARARQGFQDVLSLDPHQQIAQAALHKIEKSAQSRLTSGDLKRVYLEGIELYTEGEYRQAISAWKQVLDLNPAHEKAKMNIDKAERKLRQIKERQSG